MSMLGDASSYLLCDLDPESTADLRRWGRELRLSRCEVAQEDGMTAVSAWLERDSGQPGLVHIDPFDPDARSPCGSSAIELAAHVATSGMALVYWYGYDKPGEQAWAYPRLTDSTDAPLWCGDILVDGVNPGAGDLGRATSPGTGFGVILANVQPETIAACTSLGYALADAYAGAALPDGTRGSLVFTTNASAPAA
jgi:hypothetical protein